MTSAEMLARLRTLLDESPEGFWDDDADCYPALSIAQLEVIKSLAPFKSLALRSVLQRSAQTSLTFVQDTGLDLPADFYMIYSIKANATGGDEHTAYDRVTRNDFEDNPYMSSAADRLFYTISGTSGALKLYFETDFSGGSVTMDYITKPEDMTATVDPELDSIAHNAIIYYAFAYLLQKAKINSSNALAMYDAAINTLKF